LLAGYFRRNNGKISQLNLKDMLANGIETELDVDALLAREITGSDDVLIEI
jgi:hypothetical protein